MASSVGTPLGDTRTECMDGIGRCTGKPLQERMRHLFEASARSMASFLFFLASEGPL